MSAFRRLYDFGARLGNCSRLNEPSVKFDGGFFIIPLVTGDLRREGNGIITEQMLRLRVMAFASRTWVQMKSLVLAGGVKDGASSAWRQRIGVHDSEREDCAPFRILQQ